MRMQAGGVGFYPTGNTPWVHIDSGSVRYWPKMSRDALTRLFPDGKTVFIPADGKPMPGYEQARAEIEARGGNVQVARGGGIGGIFSWLFGGGRRRRRRGVGRAGSDDRCRVDGEARGGRNGGGYQAPEPQVEVADAGPQAVAKAKRNLPTGPAYASAPEAGAGAPSRRPRLPMSGRKRSPRPSAICRPGRLTPAPWSQRRRRQSSRRLSRSWSSPTSRATLRLTSRAAAGPKILAPLPPRRPADLVALAFADAPMPPTRPADLILASKTYRAAAFFPSRTRDLARPRSADCCRKSLRPVSTARRRARWRWPKSCRRQYDDDSASARGRPSQRPCRPCRSRALPPRP